MTFRVVFSDDAQKDLKRLKKSGVYQELYDEILLLGQEDPYELGLPLVGDLEGYWSLHCIDNRYRAIYEVLEDDGVAFVEVVGIRRQGHRRDAYAMAKKRLT